MKKKAVAISLLFMTLGLSGVAQAIDGYVWVDANGDGLPDTEILLAPSDVVELDVYISLPFSSLLNAGFLIDFNRCHLEVLDAQLFQHHLGGPSLGQELYGIILMGSSILLVYPTTLRVETFRSFRSNLSRKDLD